MHSTCHAHLAVSKQRIIYLAFAHKRYGTWKYLLENEGYCGADCYTNRQKERDCDCCGKLPNVLGSAAALRCEVAVTKALVKRVAVAVRDEAPITANSKLAVKHIVTDAIELLDVLKRGGSEGSLVAASVVSSVVLFPLRHALWLQINVDVFN